MSHSPRRPKASNALTYLIVALFGIGALAFLFLLFGELFVVAVAVFGAVGLVGGMHYVLWGRAMTEEGKRPPRVEPEVSERET